LQEEPIWVGVEQLGKKKDCANCPTKNQIKISQNKPIRVIYIIFDFNFLCIYIHNKYLNPQSIVNLWIVNLQSIFTYRFDELL
jgi:hypothetical protein